MLLRRLSEQQFLVLVTHRSMKRYLFVIFLFSIIFANSALAFNLTTDGGLNDSARETGHTSMTGVAGESPARLIGKVIKGILSFMGVVFLVLMIYGGYKWMMSAGNEQEVGKAKNTVKSAIIGLVIILAAYAITAFIGSSVTPVNEAAANCIANGGIWESNLDGTGGQCIQAGP